MVYDAFRHACGSLEKNLICRRLPEANRKLVLDVRSGTGRGPDSAISDQFGESPHIIPIDVHKDGPRSWFVVENSGAGIEGKGGIKVAHLPA